jgi:hypothetical protein
MKRLQVGDECYVREGLGGNVFKASVASLKPFFEVNLPHRLSPMILCNGTGFDSNEYAYRLVYPYPIIKQLAK